MTRSLLSKLVLLCIAGIVLALAWRILTPPEVALDRSASEGSVASTSPMTILGMRFSTYEDGGIATRVSAETFRIKPRKFGIFKVRSINEVSLSRARFEVHLDSSGPGQLKEGVLRALGGQFTSRAQGLPGMKGVGSITRAVMDDMELAFFRDKTPHLRVRAPKGAMDFKKKEIKMEGAVLEHLPSGRKIAARTIVWDDEARLFRIPGPYQAQTPGGRASGRGITVDLDFRVEKLPLAGNP